MIWHWMKKKSWKSFSWGKKSRGKVLVGVKKVGEKFWSGAKKSGGNLVGENVSHSSFFFGWPSRAQRADLEKTESEYQVSKK